MREIGLRNQLSVSVTITTLDADLARRLEPRAPRPDLRLGAVRDLNRNGIPTGVSCAPVIARDYGFPARSGGAGAGSGEGRSKTYIRKSSFLKAMFRGGFLPVSGKGVS